MPTDIYVSDAGNQLHRLTPVNADGRWALAQYAPGPQWYRQDHFLIDSWDVAEFVGELRRRGFEVD